MWMGAPQTEIQRMLPHPHGDRWETGGMQEARWTRKEDWPQIVEVHMKRMNSVSQEAYIFQYIDC